MNSTYEHSPFKVVAPNVLKANIIVPTSKSVANRLLILASVFPGDWLIKNMSDSSDVATLIECLKKIGLDISIKDKDVLVRGQFPACEIQKKEPIDLLTGDGGTTNRFLAALLARGMNTYRLIPSEKMKERPMQELMDVLLNLGAKVSRSKDGTLSIKGPLKLPKVLNVDCSRSTQFATGLALALSDTSTMVIPTKMDNSEKYFGMTKTLIERARRGIREYYVTADGSSIGYPLAMACFGGDVTLTNVHEIDPDQADFAIVDLLKEMNANLQWSKAGLRLIGDRPLKGFKADASIYPDLMMTLAFLASYAQGESILSKLEVLRHKESDRLEEIMQLLRTFEVPHQYNAGKDELIINGPAKLIAAKEIHPPVDHRAVMVSYLFMRKNSGGKLFQHHAVEKSFPTFFNVMA